MVNIIGMFTYNFSFHCERPNDQWQNKEGLFVAGLGQPHLSFCALRPWLWRSQDIHAVADDDGCEYVRATGADRRRPSPPPTMCKLRWIEIIPWIREQTKQNKKKHNRLVVERSSAFRSENVSSIWSSESDGHSSICQVRSEKQRRMFNLIHVNGSASSWIINYIWSNLKSSLERHNIHSYMKRRGATDRHKEREKEQNVNYETYEYEYLELDDMNIYIIFMTQKGSNNSQLNYSENHLS